VVISIEKDGMTAVERLVTVEAGAGVVVVDARLRRLADPVTIDGGGGTLAAAFPHRLRPPDAAPSTPPSDTVLTVTVPAGSLTEAGAFRLSALSPQGLPALLPMGYSPIVAFDLRAAQTPSAAAVHLTGLPALVLHLVQYDPAPHAWTVAVASLEPTAGVLDFALPGPGAWALVAVDAMEPPLAAPSPGATLAEAPVHSIPETARSRNFADPASLAAADSSSRIRVVVDSPDALPSGTLVQAEVTETFTPGHGQPGLGAGAARGHRLVQGGPRRPRDARVRGHGPRRRAAGGRLAPVRARGGDRRPRALRDPGRPRGGAQRRQ
jgi:hypothetical protein